MCNFWSFKIIVIEKNNSKINKILNDFDKNHSLTSKNGNLRRDFSNIILMRFIKEIRELYALGLPRSQIFLHIKSNDYFVSKYIRKNTFLRFFNHHIVNHDKN